MTRFFPDTFLSTLSLRRATVTVLGIQHRVGISIHALLAESDLGGVKIGSNITVFLSTLSLRRATHKRPLTGHALAISIHALLAESDVTDTKIEELTRISIHALLAESDQP